MASVKLHHFKLFLRQTAGLVEYLVGSEDFTQIVQQRAHDSLVQNIRRQTPIIPEQGHQHTEIDRVFQQVVVFLPDASKAAEGIGIPEHGMLELIRQLVDGCHINGAAHFGVVHKVADQVLGLAVNLLGDDDFFGKRNMGPQPRGQFARLLQGRLVPAIHFGGRFRVLGIESLRGVDINELHP